jgi:uncharacterized protein YkwD
MTTKGLGVLRPNKFPRYFGRFMIGAVTTSLVALSTSGVALAPADAIQTKTVAATTSTSSAPDIYEQRVQRLVNKRRANHGLQSLRLSTCADGTAERWSRYLAANDEFFHQSMTNVLDTCEAQYAGETLGRGTMTPRKLVRMWMQSPGHRAVLLSSESRRIGVGATPDGSGWVVAANFIRN